MNDTAKLSKTRDLGYRLFSIRRFVFLLVLIFVPLSSFAGAVITYQGRILNSDGRAVDSSNVTFKIRVYSPNPGKCLLYDEIRTISMAGSDGVFTIPIGDGAGMRTGADPGIVMEKIFSNNPSYTFNTSNTPKIVCNSGSSYTPAALDQRQLFVSFDDHSGAGEQFLPLMDVNFVPLSVNSFDAQNIGGTPASAVLRLSSGTAAPLSASNYSELLNLLSGTTTQYEKVGHLNGVSLPSLNNGQVLGWNGGWTAVTPLTGYTETDPSVKNFAKAELPSCGANTFLKNDGAGNFVCVSVMGANGGTVTSISAGVGIRTDQTGDGPVTASGSLSVDVGTNPNQIVQIGSDGKLPVLDGSNLSNVVAGGLSGSAMINTSGSISTSAAITGNSVTASQVNTKKLYIENATPNRVTIQAAVSFSDYTWVLPASQGGSGQVLGMSSTPGQLQWISPSNGSVTSITASSPLSVDSSTASAPHLSLPKADAGVSGYLDKSDWSVFNSKLSLDSSATAMGQVPVWDNSKWVPQFVRMQDIRNAWGGTQMIPSSLCAASQSMVWSVITDRFTCQNISLPATSVTGLATVATTGNYNDLGNKPTLGSLAAKSSVVTADITNGAVTTAQLGPDVGVWSVNGSDVYRATGKVGIGTTAPGASLDVGSNTDAIALPKGTTGQQPGSPSVGWIRYNTSKNSVEVYDGVAWTSISSGGTAVDPAGLIGAFPSATCPSGWLEANGAPVSRTTYASLYSVVGVMYGAGDGSTTFNLPDYRGYFLRGWSHGSGKDPNAAARTARGDGIAGDNVGTVQSDQMQGHRHLQTSDSLILTTGGSGRAADGSGNVPTGNYTLGPADDGVNGTPRVGLETRPKNINVIYCISTATVSATTVASSGSGTVNYIPQWTGSTALGNSPIAVNGSNVGIGTTSPGQKLSVAGAVESTSGGFKFPDGSTQTSAANNGPTNYNVDAWNSRTANACYNTSGRYTLRSTSYTKVSNTSKIIIEARLSLYQTSSAAITYGGFTVNGSGVYFDEQAYTVNNWEPLRLHGVLTGVSAGTITINTYIGRNDTNSVCYTTNPNSSDNSLLPASTNSIVTIYEVP